MYDELIKNLRHDSAPALQNCEFDFVYSWMLQAADVIEELEKQLDEEAEYATALACNVPHWIPVTERLPEIGKKVLVFAYGHDVLTARLRNETENDYPVFECNGIYLEMAKQGRITHWMPLPQPPKDGES